MSLLRFRQQHKMPAWHAFVLLDWAQGKLKQEDDDVPQYVGVTASVTAEYEQVLRTLWEEFKKQPTRANARRLATQIKQVSEDFWPEAVARILGVGVADLTEEHLRILDREIRAHHDFVANSLLPDIMRVFDEGGLLDASSFTLLDHRVIFMYAGALWSLGFLVSVTFDGVNVRDLGDIFVMIGPDDEATCKGPRGCHNFVNRPLTVAQILAERLWPGNFQCLTNCRHIMIPIASPLSEEQTKEEGGRFYDVAIDFDGVLHSYVSGWQGVDVILDPPTAGALNFVEDLRNEGLSIVINSTRANEDAGVQAMRSWLATFDFPELEIWTSRGKPLAGVYIDDRAYLFEGSRSWPRIETIQDFLERKT